MSDRVQPLSNDEETTPPPAPLEDENDDLEQGRGPREVEVITVDVKSPSDSPRQRSTARSRGTFLGLGDSLHSSGVSTGLGLDLSNSPGGLGIDLDLGGGRSGEAEDEEDDDEHPTSLSPVSSALTMRSAASGYVRRPSIHDTHAIDTLRQSLSHVRLSRPASMVSMASNHGRLSRQNSSTSLTSMATRKSSNNDENDDEEAQDQHDEEEEETDPHSKRFRQAIVNACHDAFGILGVDVWLHDEEDGSFHHAPGGYYRHEYYRPKGYKENMALERIEDENCVNFVPPTRQVPGAGLAGYFWSQVGNNRTNFLGKERKDINVWRDTAAIVNDPDQPPYPRMALLEQAGYGKACGVPFDIRGHRGVVLYFARATADRDQLTELANDMHLRVSADLIGAISANSITSEASLLSKGDRLAKTMRRVRAKLHTILVFSKWFKHDLPTGEIPDDFDAKVPIELRGNLTPSFRQQVSHEFQQRMRKSYRQRMTESIIDSVRQKAKVTAEKSRGGNVQPPPPMPWVQSVWVFAGAFLTLMFLSGLSSALTDSIGYGIVLGPFGALMTLQYGLTPAPASQPRNALYGQVISLSIALVVNLFMPAGWIRVPFTTALAIATMCKMGITHPPAGAAAAIFASSNEFDGVYFALMLVGNLMAISTAILINNLNDKKQYPMYYAFVKEGTKDRIVDALECVLPYFKRRRLEREQELQDELNMSLHYTLTEFNKRKSSRLLKGL
ncbi:hypothetical protein THAOC_34608 [Thalassiosira oceanica]|uniref:HPP transmembrane region domain-containing protein n=1 Tax=Thalassiosira oceanica TaxID=159749 RepID=K0R296_THAOC|nr:hypothetical protein THAOC_34608 [Thalassiosira oceanica]|eukprot:EJK46713.1 hypothetical protein THAOC_34608 [Thalassiosira oceanica]